MRKLILTLALLMVASTALAGSWPQDRAFIFYNSGLSSDLLDSLADRFTFAIGSGDSDGSDIDSLLARGSKFEWWSQYNSSTDNKIPSTEHTFLSNADTLAFYGVDSLEVFYLHFIEDTIVNLDGTLDTIPGYNPGNVFGYVDAYGDSLGVASASTAAEARVKAFSKTASRFSVNFDNPNARAMMISFNAQEVMSETPGGVQARGLFLDNAFPYQGVNGVLSVPSGGRIYEAPGYAKLNSTEFKQWWGDTGSLYYRGVRAFFDAHVDDIFGGVQRYTMPNVSNAYLWDRNKWEALLITPPYYAHMPLLEFVYSPWTHWPPSQPGTIHAKQKDAISAGIGIFESGILKASYYPHTRDDEIEAQIAGYLVHRPYIGAVTDPLQKTWFLGVNNWNPGDNSGTSQPPFSHCLNPLFDIDLGLPLADPYEIETDVWARRYELGLAVVRHSVDGDTRVDDVVTLEDPITFQLPDSYANWIPLDKLMTQGPAVTTWTLGEGMGKVFLNGDAPPQGDFYGYIPLTAGAATGTVADIVLPVKLAIADLLQARTDLYDIRFKTSDGTTLVHEYAGTSSDSASFWVKVPSLSTGTEIRVYTGDLSGELDYDPSTNEVWSDYGGVYHLNDVPGQWVPVTDSSARGNNFSFNGTWDPSHQVSGKFGPGYNTQNGRGVTTNNIDERDNWTISVWAKPSTLKTGTAAFGNPNYWFAAIYASDDTTSGYYPNIIIRDGPPWRRVGMTTNADAGCYVPLNQWSRVDFVYTETPDTTMSIYVDGHLCSSKWWLCEESHYSCISFYAPWYELGVDIDMVGRDSGLTTDPFGVMSSQYLGNTHDHYNGVWDEYRILNGFTPDEAFISTQYNAERDPVGWWTVGDYVLSSGQNVIPAITRIDGYRNAEGEQVILTGTNFGTTAGTVVIGDSNTYADAAPLVTQSIVSWSDTSIEIDYVPGGYGIATVVFMYVIHDNGEVSNGIFVPRRPGSKLPPDVEG